MNLMRMHLSLKLAPMSPHLVSFCDSSVSNSSVYAFPLLSYVAIFIKPLKYIFVFKKVIKMYFIKSKTFFLIFFFSVVSVEKVEVGLFRVGRIFLMFCISRKYSPFSIKFHPKTVLKLLLKSNYIIFSV